MSTLDLTAQTAVKTVYNVDGNTGIMTITLTNASGSVSLGQVKIEGVKFRSFVEALATIGKELYPDLAGGFLGARTNLDKNALTATTVFG